jgi:hypothetical protein
MRRLWWLAGMIAHVDASRWFDFRPWPPQICGSPMCQEGRKNALGRHTTPPDPSARGKIRTLVTVSATAVYGLIPL